MKVLALHDKLKSGEIKVTIKFKEGTVEGNPALNLYLHHDEDGDRDYLFDQEIAARHLDEPTELLSLTKNQGLLFTPRFWSGEGLPNCPAIGLDNSFRYLLFEGAGEGKGEIVFEIWEGDQVLMQNGSCWVHLLNVRKMYQRARVTPNHPDDFPHPWNLVGEFDGDTTTPPVPEIGWAWDPNGNDFVEDPSEEKHYVTHVHGWRLTYAGSQKFGETMFKRLWQSGYKGRFAFVRWPTYSADTHPITRAFFTYNNSDYRAWKSGKGLALFVNSLPAQYKKHLTAHSMGNIVAGSALREGMEVENYALLNAAVPAMCYDTNEDLYVFPRNTPDGDDDPITRALGFSGKITRDNVEKKMINFYLPQDRAVELWEDNNWLLKPYRTVLRRYDYVPWIDPGERVRIDFIFPWNHSRHLRSFHEAAAFATASRTRAVGREPDTAGAINDSVNLDARYSFGETHSAEWIWRIQRTGRFYHDLLAKFGLNRIPYPNP